MQNVKQLPFSKTKINGGENMNQNKKRAIIDSVFTTVFLGLLIYAAYSLWYIFYGVQSGADVPIGYIPAGSTNDFAASLRLSSGLLQAARDIVEGQPKRLDIGQFGKLYFLITLQSIVASCSRVIVCSGAKVVSLIPFVTPSLYAAAIYLV